MNHWIVKSEPNTYSFDDFLKEKTTNWDGIRNYQARNNLKLMKVDDLVLFYHSGSEKQIVGSCKVLKTAFGDPKDQEWIAVELQVGEKFKTPVSLIQLKADSILKEIVLVKQSRLSVTPLNITEYKKILSYSQS